MRYLLSHFSDIDKPFINDIELKRNCLNILTLTYYDDSPKRKELSDQAGKMQCVYDVKN